MKEVNRVIDCDVLVIGGGLAGCLAAISARETLGTDSTVVIVDKSKISRSGQSTFAAGIYTVFDPAEDDLDDWLEEIVHAGEYLNDQPWCRQLFENSLRVASNIDNWGTSYGKTVFLHDEQGGLDIDIQPVDTPFVKPREAYSEPPGVPVEETRVTRE